jgi:hypothetical protein
MQFWAPKVLPKATACSSPWCSKSRSSPGPSSSRWRTRWTGDLPPPKQGRHCPLNGHSFERRGVLREDQTELGEQAGQAVDATGAISLQAFAQAVHAQHALLLNALDRHEVHLRARGGLADRRPLQGALGTEAPARRQAQTVLRTVCVRAQHRWRRSCRWCPGADTG